MEATKEAAEGFTEKFTKGFACSGCLVAFTSLDAHRLHYQSEWHRVNLNRRVKGLPPVSEAHFQDALARHAAEACESCGLRLAGKTKAHQCGPKKAHTAELRGVKSEEELEAVLKERLERNRIDVSSHCPLCSGGLESFDQVWTHLQQHHGLYIPDQQYLVDPQGLVQYLADKLAVGYCLHCADGKAPFASVEAVRQHMLDKGHVKIRFDEAGSAELSDFYDWESLFEDTDSSDALLTPDGAELVLPTGSRLGSREYYRYYKQYLRPYHLDGAEEEQRKEQARSQHLVRMRGQNGQVAVTSRQYTRDEKRQQQAECVHNLKHGLALGSKANKTDQHHFRLQIR